MRKIIFLLVIITAFSGCESKVKPQEELQQTQKDKQVAGNFANENIYLLSIKYGIDKKILSKIIGEYEEMVFGWALTIQADGFLEKNKGEIVDSETAIEKLSSKYNMPKPVLADIIITQRILDKANN